MTPSLRAGHRRRRIAAAFGLGMLLVYLAWNAWYLSQGRVPPSMFTGLTGLPCPTTGGTRSFLALIQGDLARSIYFNPMTVPIAGLVAVTLACAARGCAGIWLTRTWIALLLLAWALKLLSPPATW